MNGLISVLTITFLASIFFHSIESFYHAEKKKITAVLEDFIEPLLSEDSDIEEEIKYFSVKELQEALQDKLSPSQLEDFRESIFLFNESIEEELKSSRSASTSSYSHSQRSIPLVSRASSLNAILFNRNRFESADSDSEGSRTSLPNSVALNSCGTHSYTSLNKQELTEALNAIAIADLQAENPDWEDLNRFLHPQSSLYLAKLQAENPEGWQELDRLQLPNSSFRLKSSLNPRSLKRRNDDRNDDQHNDDDEDSF